MGLNTYEGNILNVRLSVVSDVLRMLAALHFHVSFISECDSQFFCHKFSSFAVCALSNNRSNTTLRFFSC